MDMVRRCQARDLLRLAFKAWLANMEAIRHHVQGQERRAAVLHMQIRRTRAKDQLKRWLEVASGPRSRKVRRTV